MKRYGWEQYKPRTSTVAAPPAIDPQRRREIVDRMYEMIYEEAVRAIEKEKQNKT